MVPRDMHGWGITERIEQWSENVLQLGQGTPYPALYRLERQGLIRSEWSVTENNRNARYYSLTREGRRRLADEPARQTLEDGLDEELCFHIDAKTERNLRAGMSPDEARRQARLSFGDIQNVKEHTRDEFRPALVEDRTFTPMRAVNPGFTRPDEVQLLRLNIPGGEARDPR